MTLLENHIDTDGKYINDPEHPLLKSVILRHILSNLDYESLLTMRSVCTAWNLAAVEVINKLGGTGDYDLILTDNDEGSSSSLIEPQVPTRLQNFIDFELWRSEKDLVRQIEFSRIFLANPGSLLSSFIRGSWTYQIRWLSLLFLSDTQCNSIIETLLRSLPNLEKLEIALDSSPEGDDRIDVEEIIRTGIAAKDDELDKCTWSGKLKSFLLRDAFERNPSDTFQRGSRFSWNFLSNCPLLQEISLEYFLFRLDDGFIHHLDRIKLANPPQGLQCLQLLMHDDVENEPLSDNNTIQDLRPVADFINCYSLKRVKSALRIPYDGLLQILEGIEAKGGIQTLQLVTEIPECSKDVNRSYASRLFNIMTDGKLSSLTSLTLQLWQIESGGSKKPSFKDILPVPVKEAKNLTELEFISGIDFNTHRKTPEITYMVYEFIPTTFSNLIEYRGSPKNAREFKYLLQQLSKLEHLQRLSLHRFDLYSNKDNPPSKVCPITNMETGELQPSYADNLVLFGNAARNEPYEGLLGLKRLQKLTMIWYSDTLNKESVDDGFAKMIGLKYLNITRPYSTEITQYIIDRLGGQTRVTFLDNKS